MDIKKVKKAAEAWSDFLTLTLPGPQSCGKCHKQIHSIPSQDLPRYDFAAFEPGISDRWLPKARFNHRMHRMLDCLDCHPDADPTTPRQDDDNGPGTDSLAWTKHTKQIMIPGIKVCQKCHSPAGGVRYDCVLCHDYHAPRGGPGGAFDPERPALPLRIDQLNSRPSAEAE